MILAGGVGSRYNRAKQIDEIGPNGEILLDYAIYDAIQVGFTKVVLVVNHKVVNILRNRCKKFEDQIEIEIAIQQLNSKEYSTNRKKPWGTGHAVLSAESIINEPFMVLNADDYYGRSTLKSGIAFLQNCSASNRMGMIAFPLNKTLSKNGPVSRGVCSMNAESELLSIQEHESLEEKSGTICSTKSDDDLTPETLVSMNCWLFTPEVFQHLKRSFESFYAINNESERTEFYLPESVQELIANSTTQFKVLVSQEEWFGLTYAEDREIAVNRLQSYAETKHYPTPLF